MSTTRPALQMPSKKTKHCGTPVSSMLGACQVKKSYEIIDLNVSSIQTELQLSTTTSNTAPKCYTWVYQPSTAEHRSHLSWKATWAVHECQFSNGLFEPSVCLYRFTDFERYKPFELQPLRCLLLFTSAPPECCDNTSEKHRSRTEKYKIAGNKHMKILT